MLFGVHARRYIWGYIIALARSVHDTAHSKYGNQRFASPAFLPLRQYIFEAPSPQITVCVSQTILVVSHAHTNTHTNIRRNCGRRSF